MSRTDLYQKIRQRCTLVNSEKSTDYAYRKEYWKHDNILYTVMVKVTPCHDRVTRICGRIAN